MRASAEVMDDQAAVAESKVRLRQADAELAEVVELLKSVEGSVQRALGTLHAVVEERENTHKQLAAERRMYG